MKVAPGRSAVAIALVVTGLLLSSACSTSQSLSGSAPGPGGSGGPPSTVVPVDEGTPKAGGALAFGMDAEPNGLSPIENQWPMNAHIIMSSMFETLVVFDKSGQFQPYLAESMTPSEGSKQWTFKLKPNIKFHDGTPFNAEAVKANIEGQRKSLASIALKLIDTITVVDELTVEVKMNKPWAAFPGFLASQPGYMASPASIGKDDSYLKPVGTGPFMFGEWQRGTKITTKKNPNYWQAGKPYLDSIEFRIINDPTSRVNALESGDLNMLFTDSPQTMEAYQKKAGYKQLIDRSGDVQQLVLNQAAEPFNNLNARKAVVFATDSAAVTEAFSNGLLNPTNQPIAEKSQFHVADSRYPGPDLQKARDAVKQYTAETGKPLEVTINIFNGAANLVLAQLIQEQWSKADIKAKISAVEESTGISESITGKTQAKLGPNFGFPDPDWQYSFWHSDFIAPVGSISINFPHFKNDELDKALLVGRENPSLDERKLAYAKVTQILNENFVYVWLYRYAAALIAADNVRGLRAAEDLGFASISSKPWFQDLWLAKG